MWGWIRCECISWRRNGVTLWTWQLQALPSWTNESLLQPRLKVKLRWFPQGHVTSIVTPPSMVVQHAPAYFLSGTMVLLYYSTMHVLQYNIFICIIAKHYNIFIFKFQTWIPKCNFLICITLQEVFVWCQGLQRNFQGLQRNFQGRLQRNFQRFP